MKAMILAAGLGTRLKPLTDFKPKALIEIKGIPLIELILKQLIKFGYNEIIINTHHYGDQIIKFLESKSNFGINIQYSDESEQLLDTGGGILKAEWFLNDNQPFLVYNVDVVSDIDLNEMLNFHIKNKPLATLAVRDRYTNRKLIFDSDNQLCEWINISINKRKVSKAAVGEMNFLAFSGIQIVDPQIFSLISETGVFSIIDLYLRLAKEYPVKGFVHNTGFWYDMGKYKQLETFNKNMELDFIIHQ